MTKKTSLNTCDLKEVEAVKGVGKVLALRILAARGEKLFQSWEDFTDRHIEGVGPKRLQALQSVFDIDTGREGQERDGPDWNSLSSTQQQDPALPCRSAKASHTTKDSENTGSSPRATGKPQHSTSGKRAGGHVGVQSAVTETTEEPSHDSADRVEANTVPGPSTPERDTEPVHHTRVTSQHSCESEPEEDFYSPLRCGAQHHTPDLPSAASSAAPDCSDTKLPETAHLRQSGASVGQERKEATSNGYWWQDDGLSDAPFPPEFRDPKVTKQWSYVFDHIGSMEGKSGLWYLGRQLSADEAATIRQQWRDRYPKVVHSAKGGNGRETPQQRASATASKKVRMAAWDDLLTLEANEQIPPPWHMRYRSDPYGNVVALDARGSSVCAFEVDHIFPWARGGLSVPENFMALFWRSNRNIKNDRIPTAMTSDERDSMQCGLSVDQFLAILALRDAQPRKEQREFDTEMEKLLLRTVYAFPTNLASACDPGSVFFTLKECWNAAKQDLMPDTAPQSPAAQPC
ncbi:hypothetical protein COCOBI_05-6360 [Coccomyxa sp. Obi]|nr:hypothetical protein COCOBI_05-6360 [Coccomyxa sp. Obi]